MSLNVSSTDIIILRKLRLKVYAKVLAHYFIKADAKLFSCQSAIFDRFGRSNFKWIFFHNEQVFYSIFLSFHHQEYHRISDCNRNYIKLI